MKNSASIKVKKPKERYNYNQAVQRNIGIIDKATQDKISRQIVAIAGCGAEGGALAISLIRLGVRNFRLADPKIYDVYDLNRQNCEIGDINKNKCLVMNKKLLAINPNAQIDLFPQGIGEKNINHFVDKADIVIDALDYERADISNLLAKKCREKGIFMFSGVSVGFGCNVFIFNPKSKFTLEKFLSTSPFAWVPKLPAYIDAGLFADVVAGKKSAPVIINGVMAMSSLMTTQIINYISGVTVPTIPKYLSLDIQELRLGIRDILQDTRRKNNGQS